MENQAIYKILDLPDFCNRNRISQANGTCFYFGWALRVVRFFQQEPAAQSVAFPAILNLDGHMYDGQIEIYRDGHHAVRRTY